MLFRSKKLKEKSTKDTDEKGYIISMKPEDNLYKTLDNWDKIKDEIGKGQGSELTVDKNGRMKFCALHSSSALCINNFAIFKQNPKNISFLDYTDAKYFSKINGVSIINNHKYFTDMFKLIIPIIKYNMLNNLYNIRFHNHNLQSRAYREVCLLGCF